MYYILTFAAPLLVCLAVILDGMSKVYRAVMLGVIIVSSFPALTLSKEAGLAVVDNSRAVHDFYKSSDNNWPIYASWVNVYTLRYLEEFREPERFIDFMRLEEVLNPGHWRGSAMVRPSYVVIDLYDREYFGKMGAVYPQKILNPPESWRRYSSLDEKNIGLEGYRFIVFRGFCKGSCLTRNWPKGLIENCRIGHTRCP